MTEHDQSQHSSGRRGPKKPFSIANSVKPTKAPITLPTSTFKELAPSYEERDELLAKIEQLKAGMFRLETDNLRLAKDNADLAERVASYRVALNRLGVGEPSRQ